ncbi:MAG TPA: phosphorylase [Acidobacteriaceae bacterium]|nr:phosphorylase [Acidobacteriaceae bacterium]
MSSSGHSDKPSRIAILAALPRELEPLVRAWPGRSKSRQEGFWIAECDRAIAVCAGMGALRVQRAFEYALAKGPVELVISAGYAGALRPEIPASQVFWPSMVLDGYTGERYVCPEGSGTLVTTDRVLQHAEKVRMAARWNADVVDMEAAAVAKLANTCGVPFRALKVVSDALEERLPDLDCFVDQRGGFREAAFAAQLVLHPQLIPAAIRMGRNAARASRTMAQELRIFLERTD